MPLQFKTNVTSRVSTVNLERQLLHALMADRINLQRSLGKHKPDYFTNRSRQFIYDCVRRTFDDRRAVLTREMFDFEIEKRFDSEKDKARIEDFSSEFEVIRKTVQTEDIDGIIASLDDIQLANATDALIRESYAKLEAGEYQEAADLLRQKSIDLKESQKEGRILNLHGDSDDWFEEVRNRREHPEQYAGIPTGFEKFDRMTGGLFPAELTIVFGLSGKGKSTFMKALSCNIRKQGRVVLHCGNEENEFQMRSKYMSADSGEKYSPFKRGTYTDEEYSRLKIYSDNARGVGGIYIYEFPQQTDATWIERAYRYLEMQGVHVDVIVIDYLDLMKPIAKAYSENDEQGKVTSDLKQIAISCGCPVVTATQAGTQSEKQEKKAKPFLTAADVFGTKRKVHSANCLIGIVNQTATAMAQELSPEQRNLHHMVLCVPKNRDGAVFTFRQVMDVTCGKFYEDTDEDDAVMQNLEKQAVQMIDETLPPDQMRSEIDMKEIHQAKADELMRQVRELKDRMAGDGNQGDQSDEPSDGSVDEEEEYLRDMARMKSSAESDFIGEGADDEPQEDPDDQGGAGVSGDDDFFGDAPLDAKPEESPDAGDEGVSDSGDDFLNEAPDSGDGSDGGDFGEDESEDDFGDDDFGGSGDEPDEEDFGGSGDEPDEEDLKPAWKAPAVPAGTVLNPFDSRWSGAGDAAGGDRKPAGAICGEAGVAEPPASKDAPAGSSAGLRESFAFPSRNAGCRERPSAPGLSELRDRMHGAFSSLQALNASASESASEPEVEPSPESAVQGNPVSVNPVSADPAPAADSVPERVPAGRLPEPVASGEPDPPAWSPLPSRTSSSIAHKKSFAEIMAEKRRAR